VKETELKTGPRNLEQFGQGYSLWKTETVINEGVKETKPIGGESPNYPNSIIGYVINNGVKEVQPLPDQSGELIGYGNYYKLKEDRTKPFIDYLEETINFGVKENL
jgi:hypothetical protein